MDRNKIEYPPKCSYEDLRSYTNDFDKQNLIGITQFGKLYRGKISCEMEVKEVTVKIWFKHSMYPVFGYENEGRLLNEINFLQERKVKYHPSLVKLIGYCKEERDKQLGVVYDLRPLDTVHNLIPKDDFEWLHRIKVALKFAWLLDFLHAQEEPYMLRNIDAAHIVLDQDHNPKLLDFGMISGGVFPDRTKLPRQHTHGCFGYIDPHKATVGFWSPKCDVFSFGVLLLGLITKKVFERGEEEISEEEPFVYEWAQEVYTQKKSMCGFTQSKCSLVHQSLETELGFYRSDGYKITKLAMQCVEFYPSNRPTMEQIVKYLLKLRVVRYHAYALGIDQLLYGHDANAWKANSSGV